MSDLDKKLHKIIVDIASFSVDEEYATVAIKQAFMDSGWKKNESEVDEENPSLGDW